MERDRKIPLVVLVLVLILSLRGGAQADEGILRVDYKG